MVGTLTWALVGVLVYTLLAMGLRMRGLLPDAVRVQGPITTIHTGRGREFLDWLARPKRFWRAWGNFGLGVTFVVLVGSFVAVLFAGWGALTQPRASAITKPQNVLVIPGVNEFLPLGAAPAIVFGLLVGLVVHEGGHGLLCRVEDIDIESMGLALFTIVPVGAFVEPDEESRQRADRGAQSRMFAAGVTNNFAVTILAFILLFGPLAGSIVPVAGVPVGSVLPGSAADRAGIQQGDVIVQLEGTEVTSEDEFDALLANTTERTVSVTLKDGKTLTVNRSLIVTRAVVDAPIETNTTILAVNGTEVHTRPAYLAAFQNREVAAIRTGQGTVTMAAGVYAGRVIETPDPKRGLASAGAPHRPVIIARADGQRTRTPEELAAALEDTRPGQTIRVVLYVDDDDTPWDGERRTYTVTLDDHPTDDHGLIGVTAIRSGVSGILVRDFGIDAYPARQFLALIGGEGRPEAGDRAGAGGGAQADDGDEGGGGGGGDGAPVAMFFRRLAAVLVLPFASVIDPGIQYNFAGFTGMVRNFYTIQGPLAPLGGWVFVLANLAFWTGWVNLNLGFFNCIPAYPLDGGHILRTSTEAVVSRLPISDGYALSRIVTTAISLVMIAGVLLMVFGPQLLTR